MYEKNSHLRRHGICGQNSYRKSDKAGYNACTFQPGKKVTRNFPELRHITGDRLDNEDIKQIAGESWDTVIDFSCMFPVNLDEITDLLKGNAGRYIFISTASVYPMDDPEFWKEPVKETAPTLPCTPEEKVDPDILPTYGQKKLNAKGYCWLRSGWTR